MSKDLNSRTEDKNTFYITTPIYYPSDNLHIGHSYTTVAADSIARYQRLKGKDVMFLTGVDEHGQKIQQTAASQDMEPQAYVDKMAESIKELWSLMDISYDKFIRTTDAEHETTVQAVFQKLYDNGEIYKGKYEGWYCTSDEAFWTESQLEDGNCPDCGGTVYWTEEEAYFFKLSKYGDRILQLYEEHPEFLQPARSRNEMINFVKDGLEDLAVTRTSFDWGIKVPFDDKHVIYVWIDALTNYISALGFPNDADGNFAKYWPADLHLIGKEIVRFHCVIWPALLMALDVELPERVFAHGWLLLNDSKMSKSKGNVVDPVALCGRYGVDAVRYFLLREVAFGSDGNFTNETLVERINSDLANDLGNLLSRTTSMVSKYFNGILPEERQETEFDADLIATAAEAVVESSARLDKMEFSHALEAIWKLVRRANKYIDETEPWVLAKDEDKELVLANVLANLLESLRVVAVLITPFMPNTSETILRTLGADTDVSLEKAEFAVFTTDKEITQPEPLFPRLDMDEEMAWLDDMITAQQEAAKARQAAAQGLEKEGNEEVGSEEDIAEPAGKDAIEFDDFTKLELLVATVKDCVKVPKADKLLQFDLETKGGARRTVVSGLAEYYNPEDLIGRQVVLLANLKPRKIRGVVSEGMILSAENSDGSLVLLEPSVETETGAEIG